MPSPSSSLATQRPDLASFQEFDLEMNQRGFVAARVAPVLDVGLAADTPGKIPVEQLLKIGNGRPRAQRGGYDRGNWTFTTWSYATLEYGWEEPIDDRERKLYANFFDCEQIATLRAFNNVLLNAEIRMATLIFNTSTWTGASLYTDVGTTEWAQANWATATPIAHVEAAARKVKDNCGYWPNAMILNRTKFRDLRQCTEIRERIVASGAGMPAKASDITPQMLASVFDLDQVIVAGGVKDSATEGQDTTFANVWGDYAMVCRVATSADIREPCIARTFHYTPDGSQIGGTIETYRDETIRSDIVRVRHEVDEVVMYAQMGHLIAGI
jgi:hypothetical protein